MQIKNKIYIRRYLIGTMLNLVWPLLLAKSAQFSLIFLLFVIAIIVNQYFLVIVTADMIGLDKNDSIIPTPIMAILKMIILAAAFFAGINYTFNKEFYFVIFYIVQLVIFGVSMRLDVRS